tara:strand:- start:435 stop:605 length:171 start_codon:yes stop_codon:yes gene_type:complete
MSKIKNDCEHYNIPCGDHIVELKPELLQKRIKEGYRFLAYGTDGVFLNYNIENRIK